MLRGIQFMKSPVTMVTGVGGPAGQAVSQYFQQNGIAVLCADMRPLEGLQNFRLLPPASDDQFVGALDQLLDEAEIGLLVPTVTEELPKVAEHREPIRRKDCALFVSPAHAVRVANDKWETARLLMEHGVPVPASYCGNSKAELLDSIPFPMLSKPRFGRGGRGIAIHESADDVPEFLSTDRVYQEFLPAEEYDVNLFAEPGGATLTSVVLEKTELKDGLVGNALTVERVDDREVAELAAAAVRALSLEGPIDVDVRRGGDGRPFILEINARVGANVRAAEEILIAMIASWRARQ
jgi:carbamoyl-phosphate synthase large subunit